MDDYGVALAIDVVTVTSCLALLVRYADLRFSHPATPYIVFHLHTVTSRLVGLLNGASPLFGSWRGSFEPVVPAEISRAALYCDMAFWAVTAVWIFVKATPDHREPVRTDATRLDPRILRPLLFLTFVVGVVGLRLRAHIPGMEVYEGLPSDDGPTSSYVTILPSWFGLAVLGHMYYYGSRRITGILLLVYLTLMALQGSNRFRVIIALLLAVDIWVERRNRRWPSKSIVLILGFAALVFFPMKKIGSLAQTGAPLSEISDVFSDSVTEVREASAPDHMFLDELGSALTLLDIQDHRYYGSIYLPLLTLPIPRSLWPDKPILSPVLKDISTRSRPMSQAGMIMTYLGESYANFGIVGIVLVPPLLAIALARFRRWAHSAPYDSVARFSYALLSVNLIQVYRDGLASIVVFTFVNMMPLVVIVIMHLAVSFLHKRQKRGLLALPTTRVISSHPVSPSSIGNPTAEPGH